MWRLRIAVVLAFFGVAFGASPAHAADSGGTELTVRGTDARSTHIHLTNRTTAPCQVATTALGTVAVTHVDQGGAAVAPQAFYPSFEEDLNVFLRHNLKTLQPGESIDIPLRTVEAEPVGFGIEAITWAPMLSLGSVYAVDPARPVHLEINYALPISVEGAPACPAAFGSGSVSPGTQKMANWLIWALIAAGIAVVLVVIVVLLRRRRGVVSASVVLVLVLAGALGVAPRPANADIVPDADTKAAWEDCLKLFSQPGNDPAGIINRLRQSSITIKLDLSTSKQNATSFFGTTVFIHWYLSGSEEYEPGVPRTNCESLYHELYHVWDETYGKGIDRHECITDANGRTGISIKEVNATRAQNELRKKLGLPPRTKYGEHPLPTGPCKPGSKYICVGEPEVCSAETGDPHLSTLDGVRYDFQAVGEFVATRDPAGGLEIQARQRPFGNSRTVSVITAIAANINGDKVEADLTSAGPTLIVAGARRPLTPTALPGGGSIGYVPDDWGGTVTLTWPDKSTATIVSHGSFFLNLFVQPSASRAGRLEGLLGNYDGDPANDVRPRGGSPIKPSFETLYPSYADSWRVDKTSSLFTYAAGTSTDTFTDRTFPDRAVAAKDLPGHDWAEKVCRDNDVTDPIAIDACVIDLVTTGRPDVVLAAYDAQAAFGGLQIGDAATTLTIGSPGDVARIHFSGTQGQKILIDIPSSTLPDACGVVTLVAPDNAVLGSSCIIGGKGRIDATVLPATGTYTVVIDPPGNATGTAQVRLISATDVGGTLSIGGPEVSARIDQGGAVARLDFPATAGQKVFVDYTSTLPDQCSVVRLRDPSGADMAGGCVIDGKGFIDGIVLPATGTYSILVDPQGTDTGVTLLHLISVTDQSVPTTIGGSPVAATISQPGGVSRLTFTGSAGQKVGVEVTNSTVPDSCVLALRKPNGDQISGGCIIGGKGFIDGTVLPDSGQYTVVVDPSARDIGQSSVRVFAITDSQGTIAVNGSDVTVTIGQPGGVARLTFSGTAGQSVAIDVVSSTLPNQCGVVYLRDPANNEVAGGCIVDGKGGITSKTLPATGQYTIVIDPGWPDTGNAVLRLHT
jgi:hypothetical protein